MSLTNLCNLRCYFCHNEGQCKNSSIDLLSADDIIWIANIARMAGFTKFKLTGGEPTLRKDIDRIVSGMMANGIKDLSMITNGTLLKQKAHLLKKAGLPRINVSLLTLSPATFVRDIHPNAALLDRIVEGIDTALEAGYTNIKLNFIYHGSQSNDELLQVCHFASARQLTLVLLPILLINAKEEDHFITLQSLHSMLEDMGIANTQLIIDNEGLEKELITLKSGTRILLRRNELKEVYPYEECHNCDVKTECRESIFPLRLMADGHILPCLAKGRRPIDIRTHIKNRDASAVLNLIESFHVNPIMH